MTFCLLRLNHHQHRRPVSTATDRQIKKIQSLAVYSSVQYSTTNAAQLCKTAQLQTNAAVTRYDMIENDARAYGTSYCISTGQATHRTVPQEKKSLHRIRKLNNKLQLGPQLVLHVPSSAKSF